jgi:cysteine desulfurase
LRALGLSEARANASIRLGLGRFTTAAEADFAVDALAAAVSRLRKQEKVTEALGVPTSG